MKGFSIYRLKFSENLNAKKCASISCFSGCCFFGVFDFLVLHLSVSVCHVEKYYSCRPVSLPCCVDYTSIHTDAASLGLFVIELHVLNSAFSFCLTSDMMLTNSQIITVM